MNGSRIILLMRAGRLPLFSALLLIGVGGVQAAFASGDAQHAVAAPQEMNFTLEGKITKHAAGKLTVSAEQNIVFRVSYNDKTEIKRKDGGAGSAEDLRVGLRIRVEGDLTESGEVVALKIALLEEPGPKRRHSGIDLAAAQREKDGFLVNLGMGTRRIRRFAGAPRDLHLCQILSSRPLPFKRACRYT